jgi:GTP cyclohydrolase II
MKSRDALAADDDAANIGASAAAWAIDAQPAHGAAIRVDRACAELRRGRVLVLRANTLPVPALAEIGEIGERAADAAAGLLVASVETLSEVTLHDLLMGPLDGLLDGPLDGPQTGPLGGLRRAGVTPRLLLSAERLHALGWPDASTPRLLPLQARLTLAQLQQLAAAAPGVADPTLLGDAQALTSSGPDLHAALALCKRGRLLPALLVLPVLPESAKQRAALDAAQVLQLDLADVALVAPARPGALRRVSDAQVPLAAHQECTLVLFREVDGDAEHLALVVGRPAAGEPVPVRLHSACLTGDLLGSLRCDCGPQLQRAVEQLAETGGVLLYLAQEGRGTGLANKLRAYRLQDAGLDTLHADRHLGFREDERDFQAAAAMLQALGYLRIRLLTNNPQKIAALRAAGIEVIERLPLHAPVNDHNARYMHTKQQAGHLGADD